jgi:hypothetical protein
MAVRAIARAAQLFELHLGYMSTLTLAQATTTVQQGGGGDGVTEGDLLAVIVAIVLGVLTLVGVIIQQAHSVKTSYREQTKSVEDRLSKMIEGVENGVTRLNNDLKEESRALGTRLTIKPRGPASVMRASARLSPTSETGLKRFDGRCQCCVCPLDRSRGEKNLERFMVHWSG